MEAQVGDWELGAAAHEQAILKMFDQVNIQDVDTESVVRPKTGKASTPRDDTDNVVVGQEFLMKIRDFMQQEQRN